MTISPLIKIGDIPNLPSDFIKRDNFIDAINNLFKSNDIIFIDGNQGVGITTLLYDFIHSNPQNCVSHFISASYPYTYSVSCVINNIFNQLYFYSFEKEFDDNIEIDISQLNSIQGKIYKKIKQSSANLYFIFDGLEKLKEIDRNILFEALDSLPFGKAKFIFTGTNNIYEELIKSKKLKCKEITLTSFGLSETKAYFKEYDLEEDALLQLHILTSNGTVESLRDIKLLCSDKKQIIDFLTSNTTPEKENFLQHIWNNHNITPEALEIIKLVTFSDISLSLDEVSKMTSLNEQELINNIKSLLFLQVKDNKLLFYSDSFRLFSRDKLSEYKAHTLNFLITYYENDRSSPESVFNLSSLFSRAEKWDNITKLLTVERFVEILDKKQTLGNVNRMFATGYDASKKQLKFNEARLRFALHKSSIKQLENNELWIKEIEALMSLGQSEQAISLANSVTTKEDRLLLFALIAKEQKIARLPEDTTLKSQILTLYNQIDFLEIREKALTISSLLLYFDFQLAVELVEKVTDNTAGSNSLDYALTQLALYALEVNRQSKSSTKDVDTISSKIVNEELKEITKAFKFLSAEYSADQIIFHANEINNFGQKLFLIKNWIRSNPEQKELGKVIIYILGEIIKTSSENTPNSTVIAEIVHSIKNVHDIQLQNEIIKILDAQSTIISKPTRDHVRVQLIIAECLHSQKINPIDKIFDIFYSIDSLTDLSIKTDCLCLLWLWLIDNDIDSQIEKKLSTKNNLEFIIEQNLKILLRETANHFKMVESILKTISHRKPEFALKFIPNLNTIERRNFAYHAAWHHILNNTFNTPIDLKILNKIYSKQLNRKYKSEMIYSIIESFKDKKVYASEDKKIIENFYPEIHKIVNVELRCYLYTQLLQIVSSESFKNTTIEEDSILKLKNSWENVEVQYNKIQIGFLIARDVSKYSKQLANEYLEQATVLKHSETFSSSSIVNAYMLSTKLSILAFSSIAANGLNYKEQLEKLRELISHIKSTGGKLKQFSQIAARAYVNNNLELFHDIYDTNISVLLKNWQIIDTDYKINTFIEISPIIFLNNQNILIQDYLIKMNDDDVNKIVNRIVPFILTKTLHDEPISNNYRPIKIRYEEYFDVIQLLSFAKNDHIIYSLIESICNSLKENKNGLSKEQKASLSSKLIQIVETNLPSPNGIRHDGYKIAAKAEIKSLDHCSKESWQELINDTNTIFNTSDRALVLMLIADKVADNKMKLHLMESAFVLIKTIPSTYDKINRFDSSWEIWLRLNSTKMSKYLREAYDNLLGSTDGEIDGIRNIIDMAQQHDQRLAESFVSMLDQDPARRSLKEPLMKRIENKKMIKNACDNISEMQKLNIDQFQAATLQNLEEFNANKRVAKDIEDCLPIIDKASTLTLSDAYNAYTYFIKNAIKKTSTSTKSKEHLNSLFTATVENTKLIGIISSDNINKMKRLYSERFDLGGKSLIRAGESEEAESFIKSWISEREDNKLFIIDPYFTENDLEILLWIQEINPKCHVTILTSKNNNKNCNFDPEEPSKSINKEVYSKKWRTLSAEAPLSVVVKIVWDKTSKKSPFHDRWISAGDFSAALHLGTSMNGFGARDSQITTLKRSELTELNILIDQYVFREEINVGNYFLKYERFDIE